MQVDIAREGPTIQYRLALDPEDPRSFAQDGNPDRKFTLVRNEFRVIASNPENTLHPDLHAAALWLTLRPMIGARLVLPFKVSKPFSILMARRAGVELAAAPTVRPRVAPVHPRPGLLFSGGVDSLAAALVMPRNTVLLNLDRIPHPPPGEADTTDGPLIDMCQARALTLDMVRRGWCAHLLQHDHDYLYTPYPFYHSDIFHLPALYAAEACELASVATGDVFCATHFGGYHDSARSWRFSCDRVDLSEASGANATGSFGPWNVLPAVGLRRSLPILGLSEVASARIVHNSALKGRATSCYFPSNANLCLRCDKCFKKLILDYLFDDREVPSDLFEHFIRFPYLAAIFARPFFDWHHVWYYIFQRIRCSHPVALELARQARDGPDLSVLEKWYPGLANWCDASYRDEVVGNILEHIAPMDAKEQARLESLNVPPIQLPPDLQLHLTRTIVAQTLDPDSKQRHSDPRPPVDRTLESDRGLLEPGTPGFGPTSTQDSRRRQSDPSPLVDRMLKSGRGLLEPEMSAPQWCPPILRLHLARGRQLTMVLAKVARGGWRVFVDSGLDPTSLRAVRLIAASVDPRSCAPANWPDEARLRTLAEGTPLQRCVEQAVLLQWQRSGVSRYRPAWPTQGRGGTILLSLRHVVPPHDWLDLLLVERTPDAHHYETTDHIGINYLRGSRPDSRHQLIAVRRLLRDLRVAERSERERA